MSFPCYPTYKDSGVEWLGQVPGHWDVVQFKQFVDIQNGSDHKHVEQAEGYPVLGSGGVFTNASDFLYDGESVLLGRKGTIDKPLHINGRFWTVDTMYWTKINPAASGRFTYYSALIIPFDYYSTNTALPSMTKGALSSHSVARPPLSEQIQIAAFLDRETTKIDGLVAEQRRLMALLKEKRQAVISLAVTRGLNPDAPMKPSGIEWLGDVPAHWEVVRLKQLVVESVAGPYGASLTKGMYSASGYRVYGQQQVIPDDFSIGDYFISAEKYEEMHRYKVFPDDLLVSVMGTIGQVAVVPTSIAPGIINPRLVRYRCGPLIRPRYLQRVLMSRQHQEHLALESRGTTMDGLNMQTLGRVPVPIPPNTEQLQILEYVADQARKFDALTSEAQRAIDLLQERRTALISAAVTGQIDVRSSVASA
jgi:type I restriction enzyme S subunit